MLRMNEIVLTNCNNTMLNGSVALSNAGSTLLQSHCYTDASHIFRDALATLQRGLRDESDIIDTSPSTEFPTITTRGYQDNNNSNNNVNDIVDKGMKRLFNSVTEAKAPFNIHIFHDDDDPIQMEKVLSKMIYTNNIFLIKLNTISYASLNNTNNDNYNDDNSSIISAVILQNTASTHLCISFQENCSDNMSNLLLDGAYKLYCSSESILYSMVQRQDPNLLPETIICLSIVLRNIIQITYYLGLITENQNAHTKLQEIMHLIKILNSLQLFNSNRNHSPAA